jgi:hypothetical protein
MSITFGTDGKKDVVRRIFSFFHVWPLLTEMCSVSFRFSPIKRVLHIRIELIFLKR